MSDVICYRNHAGMWLYHVRPGETVRDAATRIFYLRHDWLEHIDHGFNITIEPEPWGIKYYVWRDGQDAYDNLPHALTRPRWFDGDMNLGDPGPTFQRPEGARWGNDEEPTFESSLEIFLCECKEHGTKVVRARNIDIAMGRKVEQLLAKAHPPEQEPLQVHCSDE